MIRKFARLVLAASLLSASILGFAATPLDINTANADALAETLQGVGASRAQAIVAYRDSNGPFVRVDDLAQVKGIGQRTVDLNRDRMTVDTSPAK